MTAWRKACGPRWAVSFADLCLLLLGFLVLIQAEGKRGREVAAAVGPALGGRPPHRLDLAADSLFEPGEAVLREAAKFRLASLAASDRIDIRSRGTDPGNARLDAWELAAARAAALARAIEQRGIDPARITIDFDAAGGPRQTLLVTGH